MGWRRHIPNLLSISRIAMAFAFPFLPTEYRLPAIGWACLSEFLDGFLARRWDAISVLGQALDPIADKLFVLATVGMLILEGQLTWLDFILLAMRDIIVAIGTLCVALEIGDEAMLFLKPRLSGKITTALQFTLLVCLYWRPDISAPLYFLTVIASCLSALDYLYAVLHRRFDPISERPRQVWTDAAD